jgi:hypothetical protein
MKIDEGMIAALAMIEGLEMEIRYHVGDDSGEYNTIVYTYEEALEAVRKHGGGIEINILITGTLNIDPVKALQ